MAEQLISRGYLYENNLNWLVETTFLCQLSQSEQDQLLAAMEWRAFEKNAEMIRKGEPGAGVVLLVSGQAQVQFGDSTDKADSVVVIGPGALLGERSVYLDRPTSGQVTALSPVRCLYISALKFRAVLHASLRLRSCVADLVALREQSALIMELVLRNPFFRLLGREQIERVIQSASITQVEAGESLVRAGDTSNDVYLLLQGRVGVFSPQVGNLPRTQLAMEGPGWLLGHAAVLLDGPRTADVDALEQSKFMKVSGQAFMSIVSQNSSVMRRLYQEVALLGLQSRTAPARATLLSVYGAQAGIGATSLGYGVASELATQGHPILIDLAGDKTVKRLGFPLSNDQIHGIDIVRMQVPSEWNVSVLWPQSPADTERLMHALRDERQANEYVLVVAESRDAMDKAAMALCDAVVFVREADNASHEEAARYGQFRVQAVRLSETTTAHFGPNTVRIPFDPKALDAFWRGGDLRVLRDERHAFARAARRLVRVLQGRSVGLALGGGGALGFAHIGLIQALHEVNIPIDYIAGSSFGALVAGIYAAGGQAGLQELIGQRWPLFAHVMAGAATTKTISRYVDRMLNNKLMSATEIPFFPVGMDVLTGREVVLANGTVGDGVRASSCLPGPFPAWKVGSWRLVDGGIINNVPASVTWDAGAHFIVASNIIPSPVGHVADAPSGLFAQMKSLAFGRVDDLLRSMYFLMSQAGRDRAGLADYVFDLDLQGYNPYDFPAGECIAQAGLEQARRQTAQIVQAYRDDNSSRIARKAR